MPPRIDTLLGVISSAIIAFSKTSINFAGMTWINDFMKTKDGRYAFEFRLDFREPALIYPDAFDNLLNIVKEINHNNTKYILFTTE